jgi:large subunit ribosomal protein L10
MSKQIKQMEMDSLRTTFQEVRDLLVLTTNKLDCQADHQVRTALRKKNIRIQMVKNSLARRVFGDLGITLSDPQWTGSTLFAWGASSLADLSKEVDTLLRKNDKLKVKAALSEGQEVTFQAALAMPTRTEAIGRVVGLALSPAARLVAQILAPASVVAGQLKTLSEKKPAEEGAPEAAAGAPEGAPEGAAPAAASPPG